MPRRRAAGALVVTLGQAASTVETRSCGPRVLLLSPFFAPELISTGKYNTFLARGLVAAGYDVQVVCSHPLYPDWVPAASDHQEPGMTVHRGGSGLSYPRSVIWRRLMLELWFTWHVVKHAHRRDKARHDYVVAVFPPAIFGLLPRFLFGSRTVRIVIVHDLLGVMVNSRAGLGRRLVSRAIGWIERLALHRQDKVIALSESMREALISRYGIPKHKVVMSYPFETITHLPSSGRTLEDLLPESERHVVYSGALGEKQCPQELYNFLQRVSSGTPGVCCHIFSSGPAFEQLKRHASRLAPAQQLVRFHPLVDEERLPELYERSTVQLLPQAAGVGAGAFPSKLPNLIAVGVPVFAICDADSELASVIRESGAGRVAPSWEEPALSRNFDSFLHELQGDNRRERRRRLAPFVAAHFEIQALIDRLI